MIISRFGVFNVFNAFPQAEETTGYGMLFIIGLLTSPLRRHVRRYQSFPMRIARYAKSNTLSKIAVLTPSFLYNLGRVLSYTIIGGIVGAVGSVAGFSGALKGVVQIAAGVFMVIMGLNMLNIFPWLRKFNPRMPKIFAKKINERKKQKPSLCGATERIDALRPSPSNAALCTFYRLADQRRRIHASFQFGYRSPNVRVRSLKLLFKQKFTRKIMTVSTVLVIVLGVSMFAGGISLSRISFSAFAAEINTSARNMNVANISDNVQIVTTKLSSVPMNRLRFKRIRSNGSLRRRKKI